MLILNLYREWWQYDPKVQEGYDESLWDEWLDLLYYFLGIKGSQTKSEIFISQKKYAENILKKFDMFGCKSISTMLVPKQKLKNDDDARMANATMYKSLVGSLLYMTATRLDLMFAATLLSRYMQELSINHLRARKTILKYLQGTLD